MARTWWRSPRTSVHATERSCLNYSVPGIPAPAFPAGKRRLLGQVSSANSVPPNPQGRARSVPSLAHTSVYATGWQQEAERLGRRDRRPAWLTHQPRNRRSDYQSFLAGQLSQAVNMREDLRSRWNLPPVFCVMRWVRETDGVPESLMLLRCCVWNLGKRVQELWRRRRCERLVERHASLPDMKFANNSLDGRTELLHSKSSILLIAVRQ